MKVSAFLSSQIPRYVNSRSSKAVGVQQRQGMDAVMSEWEYEPVQRLQA